MKKKLITVFLILVFITSLNAQISHPKREFRAAWVATVLNLDWPSSRNLTTEQQKQELINIFDGLEEIGINVVIFQIRAECDAFYESPYEPWSYWLTGEQGTPPSPYYDPLAFAVEEARKRGMEIHAWFNPYRSVREVGSYTISPDHVSEENPDWILRFDDLKILNPGLQEVRDYVATVIADVVRRYNIDGVHFDDYFYPYETITNEDQATFNQYPRGFTNIGNWRRDNVNIFVKQVFDSIQAIKPYVKFGISPFGIWKDGVPPGIHGLDAYSVLYADAMAWLHQHSIDYLTPQLYWEFGGDQDYGKLMPWWADSAGAYNRHLYPGQAAYRILAPYNWPASEILNQIRANRAEPDAQGSVFFRAWIGLLDNPKGLADSLKNDLYKYPALLPVMNWKDMVEPNPIQNLEFGRIASTGIAGLKWDLPNPASDGDTAVRYAVYHFTTPAPVQSDFDNAENILSIEGNRFSLPYNQNLTAPFYFAVTALDRNYNESAPSSVVEITAPNVPVLALPLDNEINQRDTVNLVWNYANGTAMYQLQISNDSTFAGFFPIFTPDTSAVVAYIIEGLQKYFWRVKASNIAGESNFSQSFSFTTGFPKTPVLLDPPHQTLDVPLDLTLTWAAADSADSYRLQLSESLTFNSQTIIFDSTGIADTTYGLSNLQSDQTYFWRVAALNQYGESKWSSSFGFKTKKTTNIAREEGIPTEYFLSQNYPNPFNPSTQIKFSLPKGGFTTLKVYDILGNEIAVMVNENLSPGNYSIGFDASKLSSGMYVYALISGNKILTKKMMVLK